MSHVWRFEPDSHMEDSREDYVPVKKTREPAWRAPEHLKMTSDMRKDYVRDEKGRQISTDKRLVLDARPRILIPERPIRYVAI